MRKQLRATWFVVGIALANGVIMPSHAVPVPPPVQVPYHSSPDFNITDSNRRFTFTNQGTVNLVGNNDILFIKGHCDEINVTGHDDTVFMGECAYPNISGHNNIVKILHDCNVLDALGSRNDIAVEGHCHDLNIYNAGNSANVDILDNLLIKGNHNAIKIRLAAGGRIEGDDNTVIYQHGIGRDHITVSQRFDVRGRRNTVKRVP